MMLKGPIRYVMRCFPPASDFTAMAFPAGAAIADGAATASRARQANSAHPARLVTEGTESS
jgi:hypothetical protein